MVYGVAPLSLQAGGMLDAVGSSSARAISTAVATACQAHPELCFTTQVCSESQSAALLIASSLATLLLPLLLSLSFSCLSPSSFQDENTFIVSHFTGECGYTISEEWIKTNSTHLPPSDQILQSLLSSSNDLLCLLAQVSMLSQKYFNVVHIMFVMCLECFSVES